mmetsp:Transcript_125230/g.401201  ORF Transcript_125230/g.401201 Transcript_125230/m.401201 type:complete len:203 (+) Transcript_125230:636-1244(+)
MGSKWWGCEDGRTAEWTTVHVASRSKWMVQARRWVVTTRSMKVPTRRKAVPWVVLAVGRRRGAVVRMANPRRRQLMEMRLRQVMRPRVAWVAAVRVAHTRRRMVWEAGARRRVAAAKGSVRPAELRPPLAREEPRAAPEPLRRGRPVPLAAAGAAATAAVAIGGVAVLLLRLQQQLLLGPSLGLPALPLVFQGPLGGAIVAL